LQGVSFDWPAALWLVRHGESAGNVARDLAHERGLARISIDAARDMDVPLSPRGREQAAAFGDWLAGERSSQPTVLLTSPYLRARETTRILAQKARLEIEPVVDERLREREFGILDRLTHLGIEREYPQQAALRKAIGKFYHRPPGGESWCDVILRLRSFVDSICREHAGARVLAVCHSVVVLCFRYLLERMTEDQILAVDRGAEVANCSLTRYERDEDRLVLRQFNFVAPLEERGADVTREPDVPVKPK
jgi:probable phosphoglycerate mutase